MTRCTPHPLGVFLSGFGLVAWVVFACGCKPGSSSSSTLRIFAASSLVEAFTDLQTAFQSKHPKFKIELSFAGSQVLRLQLEQGARADIFASANPSHMEALQRSGKVTAPQTFAYNELVLIVPQKNPAGLKSFKDLPKARKLVVGTQHVPIGSYTLKVLKQAGHAYGNAFQSQVTRHIVSYENNVRLVRAKVVLGEADAAIVYRTDARTSSKVKTIFIPASINVKARYPVAVVKAAQNKKLALQWIQFLLSRAGKHILKRHGFVVP